MIYAILYPFLYLLAVAAILALLEGGLGAE